MLSLDETLARAQAHHQAGRLDEAEPLYRQVLAADARNAPTHYLLGTLLATQGKYDQAIASLKQAVAIAPERAEAHAYLGAVRAQLKQFDDAASSLRRAIELKGDFAEAHNELAIVLVARGEFGEAEACCRRAIALKNDFAEAHSNLGALVERQGRIEEAVACYARAIELKPEMVTAHINRGKTLLQLGRFAEGWAEYEWRGRRLYRPPRTRPSWDGSPLAGRTLLVAGEQGLGDTLQFIRYVPLLQSQGARVVVEAQRPLVALLRQSGLPSVVAHGDPLPDYDVYAPVMSLPHLFGTTLESVPNRVPYLSASPPLVDDWRQRLAEVRGLKVGIVWQVSQDTPQPWRAIPLAAFETLAQVAGVRLVSLQKGLGREEIAPAVERVPLIDFGPEVDEAHGAFMDTAALMQVLDVVITADTAAAHLAGGLGVPVWVPLPFLSCWRWMLERTDSPWYPTMRLFRQDRPEDWDSVMQRIASELAQRVPGRSHD